MEVTVQEALQRAGRHVVDGDLTAAAALYRAVVEREPAQAEALNELAAIEVRFGRRHRAAKLLEKAAASKPADPIVQLNLGKLRATFGDQAAALRHYAKAIELDPNFAEAYGNL